MPFLALLLTLLGWLAPAHGASDGVLKVRANIDGAEVYVDNVRVGVVPVTTYVAPGEHTVRVVAERYDPWVRKLKFEAGKTTEAAASLVPGKGTVEWLGPAGARLTVDGRYRGMLPIHLNDLSEGEHRWKVEAPKMEPAEGELSFVAGKNLLIPVELSSSEGVVVVQSTPPGADVWLDGEKVGVTPLRLTGIALGTHDVRVEAKGRATVLREIDTSDGARGEVVATLAESGARLKVTGLGSGSEVYVNDVRVGNGPDDVVIDELEKGRITVNVIEGEHVAEGSLSLPANGTLTLRASGRDVVVVKPLVQRWGFWAAVGGVAAAGTTAGVVAAVSSVPEPLPSGDVVVVLP